MKSHFRGRLWSPTWHSTLSKPNAKIIYITPKQPKSEVLPISPLCLNHSIFNDEDMMVSTGHSRFPPNPHLQETRGQNCEKCSVASPHLFPPLQTHLDQDRGIELMTYSLFLEKYSSVGYVLGNPQSCIISKETFGDWLCLSSHSENKRSSPCLAGTKLFFTAFSPEHYSG